jgi:putative membrane-bound dehydrogenase-like protein
MYRFVAGLLPVILFASAALPEDAAVPPDKAPGKMKVPDGFRVTLFAGEPDVVKPIAMTTDDKGRLWVVESHSYPHWITDGKEGRDRVLIFADGKGTGHFDSCKVFLDKGTNLSGITVGHGGVWLCSTPNLLFIPVKDGEDKPAGKPVVVLDGWDVKKAQHNVFNNLVWGPDGWLYGCNGIQSNSRVGKPGTPDKERVALNCGVWRYHPTKQRFEVVASGTTNPWGIDFDDYGEMFITNCVIKHLFHVVPGAHYQRMYGQDLDANSYGLMEGCADHIHWAGGDWTSSRSGAAHGDAGGGHAHAGAMVYLGDNWPDEYRNHIFMCNLHGNRVNQDILERKGSGYVAHHGKDFLFANDPWFRGLVLLYGPDGGVFVADWNDTGECHNYEKTTETNGRIYKVTYGEPAKVKVDLARLGDDELVKLQLHKNEWQVRHARRLLQERAAAGKLGDGVRGQLLKLLAEQKDVPRKLRVLWALYAVGGLDEKALLGQLDSPDDVVRGWAVRLLLEDKIASDAVAAKLVQMAKDDKSATVRLALASALQRLPLKQRWPIAEALVTHGEDAEDANLPLMIWYGVEDLVPADPERAAALLAKSCMPLVRQYIARRIAASAE